MAAKLAAAEHRSTVITSKAKGKGKGKGKAEGAKGAKAAEVVDDSVDGIA